MCLFTMTTFPKIANAPLTGITLHLFQAEEQLSPPTDQKGEQIELFFICVVDQVFPPNWGLIKFSCKFNVLYHIKDNV